MRLSAAASLAASLGLCASPFLSQAGPVDHTTTQESSTTYPEEYEKAFRDAFRTSSIDRCTASANAKVEGFDFTPTCTCITDELLEANTIDELIALTNETASPTIRLVTKQCKEAQPPIAVPDGQ